MPNIPSPTRLKEFVSRTGVDSLAIAIGTSHGAFKFKPGQKPMLRFDILEEIEKRLPGFPIVLHGASSVSQEYVKIIQANGGNLADAIGIPEDMLRQAAKKRCLQNQYRLRPAFGYDSRCAGSAVPETGSL